MNYFGFSFENLFGKTLFENALNSAILLHPENEMTMVIFYEYDSETNGVIYYENEENWGSQYLPKEEVRQLYLGYRKNGYKPVVI
jgi:hypothetical protein